MRTATVVTVIVLLVFAISATWAGPLSKYEEVVLYGTYEEVPSVGWWPADASGIIAVGSVAFFEIPGNGGGLPLAIRCEIVDARITAILSEGLSDPVYVGAVGASPPSTSVRTG